MAEATQNSKSNQILGGILVFGMLFFAFNKGIDWWSSNKLIKQNDERIAFALKNNDANKCAVISNAISMANTLTDQKALDRYKKISVENYCTSPNDIDPYESAAFAEKEAKKQTPQVPYVQRYYSENDTTAKLNLVQFAKVVSNTYPALKIHFPKDASVIKFSPNDVDPNVEYVKFNNWFNVKISRKENTDDWKAFSVSVYNQNSYEESKVSAFNTCKLIWDNIDNRVRPEIDDLIKRVENYEKDGSKAMTQQIRQGYFIELDASHYNDGYPVTCLIAIDKK
ncbi:hypothetical protein [Acinetobacter gerneri]|uniref:Uncharacterized protein n=1 Tax=Acinetobacter gerneri DSM 14967 = CIP 107464 = MTCC 9824 TaxID=1120926 RepID=N8ZJL5_9GAMM|nr:hypothetical protein [Acinetobacter gerneri]ENV33939.1 hypothetical protein F960_01945 [Acinetobacter gerneri DSM 14967 = CIP 107464 = MTCC 9824]EPR82816.1 hypothetical protein L289_2734 [Acinetobacter gerneri DSM 14967 = CIP 107464 = MTCC 9824]MDV2438686.1 hypothetical protein [Acinetobacter gerneri]